MLPSRSEGAPLSNRPCQSRVPPEGSPRENQVWTRQSVLPRRRGLAWSAHARRGGRSLGPTVRSLLPSSPGASRLAKEERSSCRGQLPLGNLRAAQDLWEGLGWGGALEWDVRPFSANVPPEGGPGISEAHLSRRHRHPRGDHSCGCSSRCGRSSTGRTPGLSSARCPGQSAPSPDRSGHFPGPTWPSHSPASGTPRWHRWCPSRRRTRCPTSLGTGPPPGPDTGHLHSPASGPNPTRSLGGAREHLLRVRLEDPGRRHAPDAGHIRTASFPGPAATLAGAQRGVFFPGKGAETHCSARVSGGPDRGKLPVRAVAGGQERDPRATLGAPRGGAPWRPPPLFGASWLLCGPAWALQSPGR